MQNASGYREPPISYFNHPPGTSAWQAHVIELFGDRKIPHFKLTAPNAKQSRRVRINGCGIQERSDFLMVLILEPYGEDSILTLRDKIRKIVAKS